MKRLLFLLLLLPSLAWGQKPPINGVAGPTTSSQFGSIITDPNGTPSTGHVLFDNPTGTVTLKGVLQAIPCTALSPCPITSNILTLDLRLGSIFYVLNTATINTLTIICPSGSGANSFLLYMISNGAANAQTWSGFRWPNNTPPSFSATAGTIDQVSGISGDGCSTWMGGYILNYPAP